MVPPEVQYCYCYAAMFSTELTTYDEYEPLLDFYDDQAPVAFTCGCTSHIVVNMDSGILECGECGAPVECE